MTLEYQKDIDKINEEDNFSDCPPTDYTSKNYDAFRFVFEDLSREMSFNPVYYIDPKRFLKTPAKTKCKSISISLYNTENNATSQFSNLLEQIGDRVYATIGTHLAFSELKKEDGICDTPNKDGHISHHFVKDFDYTNRFKIISKIENS